MYYTDVYRMVTSLFTQIVYSEEKNCTCVEKCII